MVWREGPGGVMAAVCVPQTAWGQSEQPQGHSESRQGDPGQLDSSRYEEDFQRIRASQQCEWELSVTGDVQGATNVLLNEAKGHSSLDCIASPSL